ncbi:MAG: PqqD family peptide modification chaperone [Planctomycetes bacterium]|nr:PqqD family peptide modification chaperone [Planctomycetota bacterium]
MLEKKDWSLHLRRRSDLVVVPQRYGHRRYWVLKDPVAWRYVRLNEHEYAIWRNLDGHASLQQVREAFEAEFVPLKLSRSQLHGFLGDLHRKGLVLSDASGQGAELFQRDARRRFEERLRALGAVLAIRYRGMNPDPVLNLLYPLVRPLFSPVAIAGSLLLILAAVVLVAVQFQTLRARLPDFNAFFQTTNLFWIAVALAGTKVLHELGHGLTCRHFGARCHELGVMLLVFVPCLYCNVSDAWTLPNKWHRIAVTAAGVWVELVLAAACAFLWWFTEPGLLNTLCLNIMFVCSISTILFNGNPLLRYDGYYILSDWLEVPNLWQQARGYLNSLMRRFGMGLDLYQDLALRTEPRPWLFLYAVASIVYRWTVLVAILLFLFRFFEPYRAQVIAQAIMLVVLAGMIAAPLKQGWELMRSPANRRRIGWGRFALTSTAVLAGAVLLAIVPIPFRITAPLVLQVADARRVYVSVPGELESLFVKEGTAVAPGDALARLRNSQLSAEILELKGEIDVQRSRIEALKARRASDPDAGVQIPAAEQLLKDLLEQFQQRRQEAGKLILSAPVAGTVIPPPVTPEPSPGPGQLPTWSGTPLQSRNLHCKLESGTLFCLIGDPDDLEATLYVDQTDVEFVRIGQRVRLRIDTFPGRILEGEVTEFARMDAKIAPRELLPEDLPMRAGPDGVMRPLQAPYQARVRLTDPPHGLPVGSRGQAKIHASATSLASRLYRLLNRTFQFEISESPRE